MHPRPGTHVAILHSALQAITQGVRQHGRAWVLIIKRSTLLQGRTAASIRRRYAKLSRPAEVESESRPSAVQPGASMAAVEEAVETVPALVATASEPGHKTPEGGEELVDGANATNSTQEAAAGADSADDSSDTDVPHGGDGSSDSEHEQEIGGGSRASGKGGSRGSGKSGSRGSGSGRASCCDDDGGSDDGGSNSDAGDPEFLISPKQLAREIRLGGEEVKDGDIGRPRRRRVEKGQRVTRARQVEFSQVS